MTRNCISMGVFNHVVTISLLHIALARVQRLQPLMYVPAWPRSYPPVHSATGQWSPAASRLPTDGGPTICRGPASRGSMLSFGF
jgi:hypothetical protein